MHLKITDAPYFIKIPVRLKISVSLKISVRSENPYLKISVHQWASRPELSDIFGHLKVLQAAPDAKQESDKGGATKGEPERLQEHTTTEGEPESNKQFFVLHIGIEKYSQKS